MAFPDVFGLFGRPQLTAEQKAFIAESNRAKKALRTATQERKKKACHIRALITKAQESGAGAGDTTGDQGRQRVTSEAPGRSMTSFQKKGRA